MLPVWTRFNKKITGLIKFEDLLQAYYDCRKHKRNTINALYFEINFEQKLVELWNEINNRTYSIGRSIAFIVTKPKLREIFAADFRDRIIHHYIIQKLEPYLENEFIEDTYNCRKGRGTSYGIKQVHEKLEKAESLCPDLENLFIYKGDIKGFFMHINKQTLWEQLKTFIESRYKGEDLEDILWLTEMVVMHCPEKNCIRKSPPWLWEKLDKEKSLFGSDGSRGLAIGNLTSQIFANFYLNFFDHWARSTFIGYGRYVDDFYIIDRKQHILNELGNIKEKLEGISLTLHNKKFYLQHYTKGLRFIGYIIKYDRTYPYKLVVENFKSSIQKPYEQINVDSFMSSINSYLGFLNTCSSYNIKREIIKHMNPDWYKDVYFTGSIRKICKRHGKNNAN